jgi:hypothetical protein
MSLTTLGKLGARISTNQLITGTVGAGSLVGKEGYFVKVDTGLIVICGQGELAVGVLTKGAAVGGTCEICVFGRVQVVADEAAAVGALIQASATAKFEALAHTKYCLGRVLEAAAADGDLCYVELCVPWLYNTHTS